MIAHSAKRAEFCHDYEIVLVGDAMVGKTHLLTCYLGSNPAIGVELATRTVPLAARHSAGKFLSQFFVCRRTKGRYSFDRDCRGEPLQCDLPIRSCPSCVMRMMRVPGHPCDSASFHF
ncbi:unnamed protein product [Effrenium voratum]|nr:unnamed protein product [Effrenium voratum]